MKNTFEVFFLSLSRKLESFKSNAWRFVQNLSNGPSATICGVPQPIDLSTAIPHPLWRRNKHHNRVIRRGFYPVRVVQQENDRQHRFSLRGSHQVVSELRLFLVWIIYLESFVSCQFRVKNKNQFLCACLFLLVLEFSLIVFLNHSCFVKLVFVLGFVFANFRSYS